MGTYTTNYNLFMPSVGEQGWGDLVNTNFSTIDSTMKSLSNSIGTLETETDAMKEKVDAIELNNDGSVTVGSATQLSRIVTVGASDKLITLNRGGWTIFNLLPYVPGVLYTGIICCSTSTSGAPYDVYVLNGDNTYTKISITTTSPTNHNFSNAKCVYLNPTSGNDTYAIYLPTFS